MPYSTGIVADAAELKSAILSFASLNGWTVDGNFIYKGISNNELINTSSTALRIRAANSSDFSSDVCPYYYRIDHSAGFWPATYDLFIHPNPDTIVCVVRFGDNNSQVMYFGSLAKAHNDAYVGGNFFWASRFQTSTVARRCTWGSESAGMTISSGESPSANTHPIYPYATVNATFNRYVKTGIYTNIDNYGWGNSYIQEPKDMLSVQASSMLYNSPNSWNNQTILIPIDIYKQRVAYNSYIGTIGHIRQLRIDNYNVGDIIDLSPDKWKVFSWKYKNASSRNGPGIGGNHAWEDPIIHTGTMGFAVRYDGP